MKYVPRPGIVCASLCGRRVLIPTRKASDVCKTVFPLSMSGFMIWSAIEQNDSMDKLLELYGSFSRLTPEEQVTRIEEFCQKLLNMGFVIRKPIEVTGAPIETSEKTCGE